MSSSLTTQEAQRDRRRRLSYIVLSYYVIFLVASEIISYYVLANQSNSEIVRPWILTRSNPIGVFTSIFAHQSVMHYLLNAIGILALCFTLAALVCFVPFPMPRLLTGATILGPLFAAVVANLYYYVFYPNANAVGASGVAAGMLGFLMVLLVYFCFSSTIRKSVNVKPRFFWVFSLAMVILVIVLVTQAGAVSPDPNVNYFVHVLGALFGGFAAFAYSIIAKSSNQTRTVVAASA